MEWKSYPELRLIGVLQEVVGAFDVINIKACSLESPKNFCGFEGKQARSHAGSVIFGIICLTKAKLHANT